MLGWLTPLYLVCGLKTSQRYYKALNLLLRTVDPLWIDNFDKPNFNQNYNLSSWKITQVSYSKTPKNVFLWILTDKR